LVSDHDDLAAATNGAKSSRTGKGWFVLH
jgi:hypothetical protein